MDEELRLLLAHYPCLKPLAGSLREAVQRITAMHRKGGKLLLAGSGGSASDCEHIAGELIKEFKRTRRRNAAFDAAFLGKYPEDAALLGRLCPGVSAIPLCGNDAVNTALLNDVGTDVLYAQRVYAAARPGDVFLAISTSGNSGMLVNAAKVARALDVPVIALTGESGGRLREYADVLLNVPAAETYRVQELHLPVYHYLCAAAEGELFA